METWLLADLSGTIQQVLGNFKQTVDRYIMEHGRQDTVPSCCRISWAPSLLFYVGKWVARVAERILNQLLINARVDETLTKFLCRITYALLMCAVALACLERLGVQTTSLTAVLAAAGLAVGLALQGSLSNFAAGVMIILFRPFKVGDLIEAAGTKGIVEEIHIFSTMMRTPDNVDIIVPNSAVTGGNITNYSSKPIRRIDLVVGCGYCGRSAGRQAVPATTGRGRCADPQGPGAGRRGERTGRKQCRLRRTPVGQERRLLERQMGPDRKD